MIPGLLDLIQVDRGTQLESFLVAQVGILCPPNSSNVLLGATEIYLLPPSPEVPQTAQVASQLMSTKVESHWQHRDSPGHGSFW
jgi:hypothetical protein